MKKIAVAVVCLAATCAFTGPFDAFKGKVKPGLYEMKMDMDMSGNPNIPPQYAKQSHTMQHCVTEQDLEKGAFSRGRDGKSPDSGCEIKDMKTSGNSASYTMICPKMKADAQMTFTGSGYTMDMKMTMDQGKGGPMNVTQHMESKYIGPCNK